MWAMMSVVPQIATIAVTRAVVTHAMTVWRISFLLFWRKNTPGSGRAEGSRVAIILPLDNSFDQPPALCLR